MAKLNFDSPKVSEDNAYEGLGLLSTEPKLYFRSPKTPRWKQVLFIFSITALSVTMTAPLTLVVTPKLMQKAHPFTYTDCGNTSTSAREAGCGYEPMMRAWIPKECYFTDIIGDYDVFRDRHWFTDKGLSIPSNISRLESGDEEIAYTQYWHDEHCTYIFRKLAIAVEKRYSAVTYIMANIHHSHHCAHMVALRLQNSYNETFLKEDDTFTESKLNFQTCVPLNWG
jgi:hypothetical protein